MAHNLHIENGRARMMYVGDVPWHGLGTRLAEAATSAQAIKAAGLDWKVRKAPLFAIAGEGAANVPGHYAVVPDDRWGKPDCPVFGVVSEDYQPLQNVEAFEFFDSIVGQKLAIYHTAGALGKGERVWILARLPDMMEIASGDALDKYVLLSTGHDGRTCMRVILTPVRVVCQNTLTLALANGEEIARAYHTRDMDTQLAAARRAVRAMMEGFAAMQDAFRAMAAVRMTDAAVLDYVTRVFPMPLRLSGAASNAAAGDSRVPDRILRDRAGCVELFHNGVGNKADGVKGTLWAAYNGITEYVDHRGVRGGQQRMYTACFGQGYRTKTRAYVVAGEIIRTRR